MEEHDEPQTDRPIEEEDWSAEVDRLLREVEELLAELEDDATAAAEPDTQSDSTPSETVEPPEPAPETGSAPAAPEPDSEPPTRVQ